LPSKTGTSSTIATSVARAPAVARIIVPRATESSAIVTCPAGTVNDRSSTTVRGPYRLVSPRTSMLVMTRIVAGGTL
jgi:hypothetical protein